MTMKLLQRIIRYLLAGGLAFLVHLAVLAGLVEWFFVDELLATSVGFLCAVPVNFHLQRTFVFKSNGHYATEFRKYVLVTISTFLLNGLVFAILHSGVGIQYVPAQLCATVVVLAVNFTVNHFFTFALQNAK